MRFIIQILVNALAIFLADYLVPGIVFEGDILTLVIAGLILGLINFFIRPVLKLISAPLILLSLGLFTVAINMGLLWLLEYFVDELTITGLWSYFWGVLIISLLNMFFGTGRKKKKVPM
ncbi:MAG: phage holin family protein [Candidatus Portnoybacteria bacterium]